MTKSRAAIARPFRPELASRETMAYLLDMSTDTFDRLVRDGKLPAPAVCGTIRRWPVDAVIAAFDGLDNNAATRLDSGPVSAAADPWRANLRIFRGSKEGRRGAS